MKKEDLPNIAAADTLMGIFGFRRVTSDKELRKMFSKKKRKKKKPV